MPAVCRIADPITCGDTMATGSPNVFANGIPFSRVGDTTAGHYLGTTFYPPVPVTSGSPTVFVNGQPAARKTDPVADHHPPAPAPTIAVGSNDVFANGP